MTNPLVNGKVVAEDLRQAKQTILVFIVIIIILLCLVAWLSWDKDRWSDLAVKCINMMAEDYRIGGAK